MTSDRAVLALAGTMVLLSVVLSAFVSTWWLLLAAFVGLNLLQSSFSRFCPAALIFARLGLPAGCVFTTPSTAPVEYNSGNPVSPAS